MRYRTLGNPNIASRPGSCSIAAAATALAVLAASHSASADNLIRNGDFSLGNVDFTSVYTYSSNQLPANTYYIDTAPNSANSNWANFPLPAGAASNAKMMTVNGGQIGTNTVWSETVTVQPNTTYDFGASIASLFSTSPATLNFTVNGSALGPTFMAGTTVGKWVPFNATWYSGSNSSATLAIVDTNTDAFGNDFALTEICLSTESACAKGLAAVSSLQPATADAGSPEFTLTVNGSNFVNGDTVEWNGVSLATTFVSASKLTAKVPAADVATAGSAAVSVLNAAAGTQANNAALFSIPLTSLVISSQTITADSGGYSIELTLENAGYNAATDISITGVFLATTATSTPLPVEIASIQPKGTKTLTFRFPSSAGKPGEEEYLLIYGSYAGGGMTLSAVDTLP